MLVVGLAASSTPWWFKLGVLALGVMLFRWIRRLSTEVREQAEGHGSGDPALQRVGFGRRQPGQASGMPSGQAQPIPNPAGFAAQSGSIPKEFEPELLRLDLYERGLGKAAIRYVATGEETSVLHRITTLRSSTPKYQQPFFKDSTAKNEAEAVANLGMMRPDIPAGPQVARFLQIRLLADPPMPGYGQPTLSEEQLLARAPFNAVRAALSKLTVSPSYKTPWAEARSLRQMHELVKCCGGTMVNFFESLLSHHAVAYFDKGSWYESSDCVDFIRTYPAAFAAAVPGLQPKQRMGTIKLAEHHGCIKLPEILALLVAMLVKPYDKEEREAAISTLARMDAASLRELIARELPSADIDTRHGLVQAAGRNNSPELLELLRERAKIEKAAKVKGAIEALLEAGSHGVGEPSDSVTLDSSYLAVTGETIALPPLPVDPLATPGEDSRATLDALVEVFNAGRSANLAKGGARKQWQLDRLQPITPEIADQAFAWLCGKSAGDDQFRMHFCDDLRRVGDTAKSLEWLGSMPLNFALRVAVWMGGVSVGPIAKPDYYDKHCAARQFLRSCVERGLDMRIIASLGSRFRPTDAFDEASEVWLVAKDSHSLRQMLKDEQQAYYEKQWRNPLEQFPSETVWPWLAENMAVFDEALGLAPMKEPVSLKKALTVLAMLPALPQRYYARVVEIAVTEKRPLRRQAMALLKGAKDLDKRLEALLDDPRQPVRINAATWLADIRATNAEAALRKRLKKEKSDPVRTALIEALQRLDAELSDVISPKSLIAEAQTAMAKGAVNLPDWLPVNSLPSAAFRDGTSLPPELLRYWLALAIRLKDPSATGQFGIYLDQLQPADARALSGWILDHWIAFDTYSPSLDEANAYARQYAESTQRAQQYFYHTVEEAFEALKRRRLAELPNSGSDTKGMLALACRADPVWAAQRVRWFLKNHGRRSNQAMALLDMLAGMGSPVALQVVIAASVRLKQKSTQKHAAEIADRYAEDRGWSVDELADRTVPSAGFDDYGELALPCGDDERPYLARLDAQLEIHLFNPEGKAVKALPAGDDEATRESKKALTTAKKELKQIVDMQSGRLFEAMCVERSWPVADWRNAFHEHPVMRRLVERLVWQGLDPEGAAVGLFRPTQEGDFTDAGENMVDVDRFARLRLAHGALVDAATSEAWLAHLRDYEVKPLIAQFGTTRAPLSTEEGEGSMIEDRKGWLADSLTYRGIAEKRGYERVMGDGGGCNEYEKPFPSHGLAATIHHSGSYAQDENNAVALKGLSFRKVGQYTPLKLKDVPPVMLAECWADFHALAEKGKFDPEWEKKAPW